MVIPASGGSTARVASEQRGQTVGPSSAACPSSASPTMNLSPSRTASMTWTSDHVTVAVRGRERIDIHASNEVRRHSSRGWPSC